MSRWKVTRAQAPTSSGKIWQAWEGDQRRKVLRTWREAVDYADRQARTVEVVLPRQTVMPTSRHIVHKNGLIIEWVQNPDFPSLPPKYLTVKPEERRPLAGALYALAEQEEQCRE